MASIFILPVSALAIPGLIISTFINIGLDLLFVLVFKWGIAGVAIASVLAQGGAFFTAVIYLNRTHKIIRFSFKDLSFDKVIFKKSVKIGLPTGLQQSFGNSLAVIME